MSGDREPYDIPSAEVLPGPAARVVPSRDGRVRLGERAIEVDRVVRGGRTVVDYLPLDEPGDVRFLALPAQDLEDGRPLRRAAFEIWAAHVRARLAAGATWETAYRARQPYHTLFGMLGGLLVGLSSLYAVLAWASSDPKVTHRPGLVESVVLAAGIGVLLWIAFATLSSAARLFLSRGGSFVRIDRRGLMFAKNDLGRPPSDVVGAAYRPWLRATEVRTRDGVTLWVPRERGPLVRLDLILAALPGGPPAAV